MERTAWYRSYAAECLEAAQRASDPALKTLLVEMAASWHRLAIEDSAKGMTAPMLNSWQGAIFALLGRDLD